MEKVYKITLTAQARVLSCTITKHTPTFKEEYGYFAN